MTDNVAVKDNFKIPTFLKISKIAVWALYFWTILGIVFLVLRVILLALSANAQVGFTKFVYNVSGTYMHPFNGIFPSKPINQTGYLDVSALFAIIIYLLFLWAVSALVSYVQSKIDLANAKHQAELNEIKRQETLAALKAKNTNRRPVN